MDNTIYLTQDIDNDSIMGINGYIDNIEDQFKTASKNQDLEVVVCSGGGDIYQGNRISDLIMSHEGNTIANVTGIAASMAGVLLADFDHVRMEKNGRVMLHKAHAENASDEDVVEMKKFNRSAYDRIKAKIEKKNNTYKDESIRLLDKIFLDDTFNKDVNFTAQEALKFGLVDEVYEVERIDGSPVINKIAASLRDYNLEYSKLIYNKYKMGLTDFLSNKKSPTIVARTAELTSGATIVFNSADEQLKQGDDVALIGSADLVNGEVLQGDKVAKIEDSKVTAIEDMELDESSENMSSMFSEMKDMIMSLSDRIEKLERSSQVDNKSREHEIKDGLTSVTNEIEQIKASLSGKALQSNYSLPKVGVTEIQNKDSYLGASREQAIRLNNAIKKDK